VSQVLYRDPIFDGATDPIVVFNRSEQRWWMLYTSRRANAAGSDVSWVHGTDIGVASLMPDGRTWLYRGTLALDHEFGRNTFWAPDVVWGGDRYHMYVSYVRGVPREWVGHARHIIHYTSGDMLRWDCHGAIGLSSDYTIDACVCAAPGGGYRMWYKDEADGSATWVAESEDLFAWKYPRRALVTVGGHEGPKVFWFKGWYWLVVDTWSGLAAFRSSDQVGWEAAGDLLTCSDGEPPGEGVDVGPGHHADVVVIRDRAFIFYFTHPYCEVDGASQWDRRRSVVLAAELEEKQGILVCERQAAVDNILPC